MYKNVWCKCAITYSEVIKMANEKMYTIKEIAQIFHVSRKTVYDWVRKGKMPVVRSPGGGKMYVSEAWLQQQLQISGDDKK